MLNARVAAALPFASLGTAAIVAAGATAAAIAYHPTQPLVWMVAYLVLVVGVMQWVFGAGQAWLAGNAPARGTVWGQWLLLNLGNAGVIGGTLCASPVVVVAGTLLFALALVWFLLGVRHPRRRGWGLTYRVAVGLLLLSACVGVAIAFVSHAPR